MIGLKNFLLFCILFLFWHNIFCQKSNNLKKEQQKIRKEIELIESLIKETTVKKKESTVELNLIQQKINARNSFINTTTKEISLIDQKVKENSSLIESLINDLNTIKKEYAELIYKAYCKRRKESFLMYIFSAESFNQAYKRIKYMQLYNEYKRSQAKLIIAYRKVLNIKNDELNVQMEQKRFALESNRKELNLINIEKRRRNNILVSLQQKESELKREIEEKKRTAKRLENEIAKIIAEERKKSKSNSLFDMLTAEEKLISGNFELNKGRLPWPVSRGVVTGKFGIHDHPVLKNVKIRNDGIYISTVMGSEVLCVFDGVVSRVFSLPGSNYAVIIKHGNYFTLYNNLVKVNVKEGDKVVTKQKIGIVYSDIEKGENIVHFQVWKEMERNDPETWLSR